MGGSIDKRRRIIQDPIQQPLPDPGNSYVVGVPAIAIPPLFDLNLTVPNHETDNSLTHGDDQCSSNEISSILRVGQEVGFQISDEDPIIKEMVLNGDGGVEIPQ